MLLGVPQTKYAVEKKKNWGSAACFRSQNAHLFPCLIHPTVKKPIKISNSLSSGFPVNLNKDELYICFPVFYGYYFGQMMPSGNRKLDYTTRGLDVRGVSNFQDACHQRVRLTATGLNAELGRGTQAE